jgi:hypothetical protein
METPKNSLTFDEATHTYSVNGRRLMSVTQVLALVDDRHKGDPFYLQRGRFVHQACEYLDRDELDEDSVDPIIYPYLEAYKKFREETGFKPDLIECRLYHPTYAYAGTLDRIGDLNGNHVLIDLKSGAKARVDELQLAAYLELARANSIPVKKSFDLYLRDDGTYKLEPVENVKLLLPVFLSILTASRWKEGL